MDRLPFIEAPQGERPVVLAGLDVRAVICGLLAETTQTLRFYNPNPRPLEGTLVFPMSDGATVCGYAIDVEGQMVEGVVVERNEARRILEAEVRKGVDPGLVEQVAGNVYRTRIYPLPAKGTRIVRLTTVSELTVEGNQAACHLPLAHARDIEAVDLHLRVVQAPVTPLVEGGLGNLTLKRWESSWVAEARLGRGAPADDLLVRLPDLPPHFVTVERGAEGEHYFCASVKLTPSRRRSTTLKRLALCWDASGSLEGSRELELAVLQDLLDRFPDLTVDLVVLRDALAASPRTFSVGEGQALLDVLRSLPADGGTHLQALDLSRPPHPDDEAWLFFSDGLSTLGEDLPSTGSLPVHTLWARARSHSTLLSHLALVTGGLALNLLRTKPQAAGERLAAHDPQSAPRVQTASGCADLHLSHGSGRLSVLGRLTEAEGRVVLGGETLTIDSRQAEDGRIVARAWAGQQAASLALRGRQTRPAILELGRRHGLVTPGSSLLVLETLEQHLEHGILPPPSRPSLREAYLREIDRRTTDKKRTEEEHLQGVLARWQERIAWWETDFRPRWHEAPHQPIIPAMVGAGLAMPSPAAPSMSIMDRVGNALRSLMPQPRPEAGAEPPADLPLAAEAAPEAYAMDAELEECASGPAPASRADADEAPSAPAASIQVQAWSPDTPYLRALKAVNKEKAYETYLKERKSYLNSPSFYIDCGDYLLGMGLRAEGLRVLSNLPELGLDDAALLRMYAWRLQQAGELDGAIAALDRVLADRGDEPQSYRDLGLALAERWQRGGLKGDLHRAIALLYEVVRRPWDRFPEIEVIALMELNRLLHLARDAGLALPSDIDARLVRHLPLDLRISLSWDADLTDVDLHVHEPSGEHAYYGQNRTRIGGLVSRDMRQGYGPEEYVLRRAMPGTYAIKAHYFGSSQQSLTGPCTLIAQVFTAYGRPEEQRQTLTLRLERPGDQVPVGEVVIPDENASPQARSESGWRARFSALRKGMSVGAVTEAVGQPASISGEDALVLLYRPEAGVVVQVHLSPRLTRVVQVMDGAELDLLSQ